MVIPLLLTGLFLGILTAFGVLVALTQLRVRTLTALLGLGVAIGLATDLVLLNALGHVAPIGPSFWIVPGILLLLSSVMLAWTARRGMQPLHDLEIPPRSLLLILGFVILISGIAYARDAGSDPWTRTTLALPAWITAGNFPLLDPVTPDVPYSYHYGAGLLAAQFAAITGFTVATGYAVQPMLVALIIVLCATSLGWNLIRQAGMPAPMAWKAGALTGILAFAGAGLWWLAGTGVLRDLTDVYIHGKQLVPEGQTAFRGVTGLIRSMYSNGPLMIINHRPIALGLAFFHALLLAVEELSRSVQWYRRIAWGVSAVILGAALAHTAETTVILLTAATVAALALCIPFFRMRRWVALSVSLLGVITATLLIAAVQGGVLTAMWHNVGGSTFTLTPVLRIRHDCLGNDAIALWEWRFLRDYGVPLFLFPFSVLLAWKRRKENAFPLFLCLLAFIAFATAVSVVYEHAICEMNRILNIFVTVTAFLAGLTVWHFFLKAPSTRLRRTAGVVLVAAMLISGALNVTSRLLFPTLRMEARPFLPGLPSVTPQQRRLYDWIVTNTRHDDFIYMRTPPNMREEELNPILRDRLRFGVYTGRYVLDTHTAIYPPKDKASLWPDLEKTCSADLLHGIKAKYILLETTLDQQWFTLRCNPKEWTLVYKDSEEALPAMYELLK